MTPISNCLSRISPLETCNRLLPSKRKLRPWKVNSKKLGNCWKMAIKRHRRKSRNWRVKEIGRRKKLNFGWRVGEGKIRKGRGPCHASQHIRKIQVRVKVEQRNFEGSEWESGMLEVKESMEGMEAEQRIREVKNMVKSKQLLLGH